MNTLDLIFLVFWTKLPFLGLLFNGRSHTELPNVSNARSDDQRACKTRVVGAAAQSPEHCWVWNLIIFLNLLWENPLTIHPFTPKISKIWKIGWLGCALHSQKVYFGWNLIFFWSKFNVFWSILGIWCTHLNTSVCTSASSWERHRSPESAPKRRDAWPVGHLGAPYKRHKRIACASSSCASLMTRLLRSVNEACQELSPAYNTWTTISGASAPKLLLRSVNTFCHFFDFHYFFVFSLISYDIKVWKAGPVMRSNY